MPGRAHWCLERARSKVGGKTSPFWFGSRLSRLGPNQLTARKVETAKDGVYADGGNLWLIVDGKAKRWAVRYTSPVTGKRREMGLGAVRDLSLAEAREEATAARRLLRAGTDPIEQRRTTKAAARRRLGLEFAAVSARYIEEQRPGWRDHRLPTVWTSSLARFANPVIGDMPIDKVTTDEVLAILRPIWATKNETADRVRGRIERVLDYARIHGWREGENPARWRGHLEHILPRGSAVSQVEHRAAVPYKQIAAVMAALARSQGLGAQAVRFACLTAARSMEVRAAPWSEVDLAGRMWIIPAERMKMKREHRVPLSEPAIAILETVRPLASRSDDLIFPGGRPGRPLSDVALSKALHLAAGTKDVTVHGLRSTFRDWCAEATDYPHEVAEMALAHVVSNRVEAAYRRGDLLEKRRAVMEEWGAFCGSWDGTVLSSSLPIA